jgi:hypothetical protein
MSDPLLSTSISYPVVIGLSLFSIVWGVINVILIRKVDMKDSTHIKAAKKDVEQRLLQNNDDLSGSVNCLNEMKKIASLIEAGAITFLK